ncbi:murein hydrolase activator EnvC family protein [Streptomyces griseosporeus]
MREKRSVHAVLWPAVALLLVLAAVSPLAWAEAGPPVYGAGPAREPTTPPAPAAPEEGPVPAREPVPSQEPVPAEEPVPSQPPVPALARFWPVGVRPTVVRGWDPPLTPYGRGHRGVDLAAAPKSPVRAVAAGRVTFAGRVAGKGVVSIELSGTELRTTYEPVRASVDKGDEVAAGEVVGTVEATGTHCPAGCLHWGLRRGEAYLDPLSLLPPALLRRSPSRLLPVLT